MSDDQVVLEDNVPLPNVRVATSRRKKYLEAMLRMEVGQSFVVDNKDDLGAIADPNQKYSPSAWTCVLSLNQKHKGHKKWTARWIDRFKSIRVWRVL